MDGALKSPDWADSASHMFWRCCVIVLKQYLGIAQSRLDVIDHNS